LRGRSWHSTPTTTCNHRLNFLQYPPTRSFRRQKEKNQLSDAQKAALRTTFGEIEEDEFQDEAPRAKVGVVSGRARAYESNQKVGAVSKRMQKRLQQQAKVSGGMSTIRGSNTSGTASVSFTPLQVRGWRFMGDLRGCRRGYCLEKEGHFLCFKPGGRWTLFRALSYSFLCSHRGLRL
jgi:hypothetical protein